MHGTTYISVVRYIDLEYVYCSLHHRIATLQKEHIMKLKWINVFIVSIGHIIDIKQRK